MMSWLARQDGYDPNAFDVPLDQGTNVGWANRMGEILTTRPTYDEQTVLHSTASPLVNITEGDIGRATEAAMGVSGGGMKVEPVKGIKAYHSSPHDFDKFDLAKIGSGEGAQSYGHGLYFAENPAVSGQGGQYWQQFAHQHPEALAARYLQDRGFDRSKALADAREWVALTDRLGSPATNPKEARDLLQLLESGQPVGPRTYEVNINADPAHMLDWDKPLSQQSERVRAAIPDIVKSEEMYRARYPHSPMADPFGSNIYSKVGATGGLRIPEAKAQASEFLREAGIPGIKYLDEGSRRPAISTGYKNIDIELGLHGGNWEAFKQAKLGKSKVLDDAIRDIDAKGGPQFGPQTSNYVVFDPNIIDIMKKYAVPGAIGTGGMGALAAQDEYRGAY